MKTLKLLSLLACMILCSTTNLFSQDLILLSNGNEIEAKIIKIGDSEIEYKKWSYLDGPAYTEKKANIFMIKYQNGEKDVFNNIETPISSSATTHVVESESLIKPQSIKKDNKIFFGINVGEGLSLVDDDYYSSVYGSDFNSYIGFASTIGLDLTFPIGKVFAIGPYVSLGYDSYSFATTFGGWTMFKFKNKSALMVGGGGNLIDFDSWGISGRIGFKFPNRIYIFGEITTSSYYSSYYYYDYDYSQFNSYSIDTFSFLFHFGIRLN